MYYCKRLYLKGVLIKPVSSALGCHGKASHSCAYGVPEILAPQRLGGM